MLIKPSILFRTTGNLKLVHRKEHSVNSLSHSQKV
ncbi:hypothetical protein T4D_1436 [Trichinella pseudospiralis]|uniref:Uncharacterized protein n=1 Tax=Trichinella pseudospiralis TaxID=6337 RepID=A0A0V1DSR9_TRIPS|nr:hypothetical protein T4D_1436 [Trichinella pseudospiralis]